MNRSKQKERKSKVPTYRFRLFSNFLTMKPRAKQEQTGAAQMGTLSSLLPPFPPVQNLDSRNEQEQTEGTEEQGFSPRVTPV